MSNATNPAAVTITVPGWVDELAAAQPCDDSDEARMALVVRLARRNVEEAGGPFAAAVFDGPRLLAAGVNRVLDSGFSIAHAEIVALMRAQQTARGNVAASAAAVPPSAVADGAAATRIMTLVTSTEPCCQCFGALIWSGVTRLVCGATTADAESIGFDEGPKPDGWPQLLESRGMSVTLQVLRDQSRAVLTEYSRRGGPIYGLRHPTIG